MKINSITVAGFKNIKKTKLELDSICALISANNYGKSNLMEAIDFGFDFIHESRKVRKNTLEPIAIMYDTKGPEFRTLEFENEGIQINTGETIWMVKESVVGNSSQFSVNHPEAINAIQVGNHVLIDNALLDLVVIEKEEHGVLLRACNDGEIKNHKTINVPGVHLNLPFISEQDRDDIIYASQHSCDYLALSFVNTADDVREVRSIIENSGGDARIISKIESQMGIDNIDAIIAESDGIMVARGDLGVEVPMEKLPTLQKEIIRKCRENGKFAIVATEMLASMYTNPRPTRAEVSDIANAVLDGTDCVMLSGETTVGKYPVSAVDFMSRICESVEETIDYSKHTAYRREIGVSDTIAKLVVDAVEYDNIKLIVTTTMTGYTARKISNLRPNCTIMACCPSNHIAEKLALNFGVKPVVTEIFHSTDQMVEAARYIAQEEFQLKEGDLIVVTGGFPLGKTRMTNYIRIVEV